MNLIRSAVLTCLVSFGLSLSAQSVLYRGQEANRKFDKASEYRFDQARDLPSYVLLRQGEEVDQSQFFSLLKNGLKLDPGFSFKLDFQNEDQLGDWHKTYSQYLNGIKVAYSKLRVHGRNNEVISFNGNFINVLPGAQSPGIDKQAAFQNAIRFMDAEEFYGKEETYYNYGSNTENGTLVYLPSYHKEGQNKLTLVYQFNLYAKQPHARNMLFVNATTGEIEFSESLIHTGNSEGTAITAYSDTQQIITDSLFATFRLRDYSRGNGIETFDAQRTRNFSSAVDFFDTDNVWNNVNANLDQYATDAHWGTEMFYDYLDSVFSGIALMMLVLP